MLRSKAAGRTGGARGYCLGGSQHQQEQHQAHGQERFHPCRIKFMLAHIFPCCQFSKISPQTRLVITEIWGGAVSRERYHQCPMADVDMGGEAPETRPVPALPGHPGSPVLPDFHMATKALPHRAPGHWRGARAAPWPPKTQPHSQAPCTPAAQRSIISRSRRCCGNDAAANLAGGNIGARTLFALNWQSRRMHGKNA